MIRSQWSNRPYRSALLALSTGLATACGPAEDTASDANGGEVHTPSTAAQSYSAGDQGNGTLWVDGVQFANFRGSCDIARQNGAEDLGELSNPAGLKMLAGIDNVDAASGDDMSFKVTSDSIMKFRRGLTPERRGTITRVALESEPARKSESTMLALVSFTGATLSGTSVEAHIVCELQNKYR